MNDEIDKAAQEAWDLFKAASIWTREGNFRKGFRAGAEWRDKQRSDKTEALEALERMREEDYRLSPGHLELHKRQADEDYQTIRRALTSERGVGGVVGEIQAERQRQIEKEGWSAVHDDEHDYGELSQAAAAYATVASAQARGASAEEFPADMMMSEGEWPWGEEWWKPKDPRRNLIRAAALIVAEIERLDRSAAPEPEEGK